MIVVKMLVVLCQFSLKLQRIRGLYRSYSLPIYVYLKDSEIFLQKANFVKNPFVTLPHHIEASNSVKEKGMVGS